MDGIPLNPVADYDILVLGATGYTGRLVTRYLSKHPQRASFTVVLGARSQERLATLARDLDLPDSVGRLQVDVLAYEDVEKAVRRARVVLNTVGPYWTWGTNVVRACVAQGVHYVDLTGETVWIKEMITTFDYAATQTRSIIVPSCGMDSIPSDLSAYLAHQALCAAAPGMEVELDTSITAFDVSGGISGGSLSSVMTMFEDVPKPKRRAAALDHSISPVKGLPVPMKLLHSLRIFPRTHAPRTLQGALFFMRPVNKALVDRTWGLKELAARDGTEATDESKQARYGPAFRYDEFMVMSSRPVAALFVSAFLLVLGLVAYVPPVRWVAKKLLPKPGSGPSESALLAGHVTATNLTTTAASPPMRAHSVIKGKGDPGYLLTAVMISESALCLLLPPPLDSNLGSAGDTKSRPAPALPPLARRGGLLTPVTAFGDVLVARLRASGLFQFDAWVIGDKDE
ncbi:Saccharopine dehydrogenase-domain-containing protein [Infundibulicybe gibba]|nr:Saccharopine dehydrogenase-domain-containing protein [Infundibulicybe gibba]